MKEMIPLTEIYCLMDDFCKTMGADESRHFLPSEHRQRYRSCAMSIAEIMTITVMFHLSHYRTFKDFYIHCLRPHYHQEFPTLLSYNRLLELLPFVFMPLVVLLSSLEGSRTGRYDVDSTKLPVCDMLRMKRHKVFRCFAKLGKTSTGWFFGFKLHIVLNHHGEIMRFFLSPGNTDDRKPVAMMMKGYRGG